MQFLGDIPKTRIPTPTADVKGKSLRIKRQIGKPGQLLLFHLLTPAAENPTDFHIQVDPHVAAGKIPNPADFPVVETVVNTATGSANRFFPLRMNPITRAFGSP
jgi:hypothetical protein